MVTDNIFKSSYFNENAWISIKMSLKIAPAYGSVGNKPALVQVMLGAVHATASVS